jgi:transcriptional regulator with XRE-family HTH domain
MGTKLGEFLVEARNRAGLSQKEVSEIFGYNTPQVVSDWERGVRYPSSHILPKLIKLYDIDPESFFLIMLEEKSAILEKKLRAELGMAPARRRKAR